jgi:SAM-dependent methyltransferase
MAKLYDHQSVFQETFLSATASSMIEKRICGMVFAAPPAMYSHHYRPMTNLILKKLQSSVARSRHLGINRCNDWAGQMAAALKPDSILDVGCGDGSMLFRYFKQVPREFYGVEGAPELQARAEARGIKVSSYDLNGRWPFADNKFDVVFSNQVIEHLHNARLFAMEAFRVLKPGGTAIVTSENLCSLLNCLALFLGYTPFSLMQTCGRYLGNPLGLHYNETLAEPLPLDHPAFSGVSGHVRVLTVRQARELFQLVGFEAEVRSISILPLPDGLSKMLEGVIKNRGHYLMIKARKPLGTSVKPS